MPCAFRIRLVENTKGHLLAICAYNCCLCLCVYAKDGQTPLWHAVSAGSCGMAKLLIDYNADVNVLHKQVSRWEDVSVARVWA